MKIRSALLQTTKNLEPIFELEKIDNKVILQCLTNSFKTIRGFSKNINKETTNYYEELLGNIYYEDIPITDKMLREAKYIFGKLLEEKDVKSYINNYFWLLKTLLIFNNPFDEGCNVCEGVLFYYFDEGEKDLIKICNTCSMICIASTNEIAESNVKRRLRPARKNEIKF